MKDLTEENFDREILLSPNVVVVDFYATWRGPCKTAAAVLLNLENSYPNVDFFKVDIDTNRELAQRFKVSSVPTFKFISKGRTLRTQVGMISPQEIEATIRSLLDNPTS